LYGTTHVRRLCDETGVKVPGYEDDDDGDDADADRGGKGKRYAPVPGDPEAWRRKAARALADELGVTVVSKGATDEIRSVGSLDRRDRPHNVHAMGGDGRDADHFDDVVEWCPVLTRTCDAPGMPRRCGGQGDVLAGSLATFLAWASAGVSVRRARGLRIPRSHTLSAAEKVSAAAHAARVTRDAARIAFGKKKRATTASDVAEALGEAFEARFPADRASYASSEERATSQKNEKRA